MSNNPEFLSPEIGVPRVEALTEVRLGTRGREPKLAQTRARRYPGAAVRRARAETEAEFTAWYGEHYQQAFRIALRLHGNEAAAEDAAAEAFARAFALWPKVRPLPHRDAWVMRVTANVALSALARRRAPEPRADSSEHEDHTATRLALVAALHELPQRQREVVVLRYLGGLREHDVALALGITPNTVKTHLKRAMSALRNEMVQPAEVPEIVS